MVSLGAGTVIVEPMDDKKRWVFKTPYNDSTHAEATARNMKAAGLTTAGVVAISDAYGESWLKEFTKASKENGIAIVDVERYDRNDTSVVAQVLKLMAKKPAAVLVAAGGTPGVLPQVTLRERGYKGPVYQTTGITNNEFIRVGGKNVEGTLVSSGPFMVADDIPSGHPAKTAAESFKARYEKAYGTGSATAFSGIAWNAGLILDAAIEKAVKVAKPGTAEFRVALRDAMENGGAIATTDGINKMSPTDHSGYSADSAVMVTVKDGRWRLVK
jgi:branched-chain amino acid transport system substrate-binding protein